MNTEQIVLQFLNNLQQLCDKAFRICMTDDVDTANIQLINTLITNPKRRTIEALETLIEYNKQLLIRFAENKRRVELVQYEEWVKQIFGKIQEFVDLTGYQFVSEELIGHYSEILTYMDTNGYEYSRKQLFKDNIETESDVRRNIQLISYFCNVIRAEQFKVQFESISDSLQKITEDTAALINQ